MIFAVAGDDARVFLVAEVDDLLDRVDPAPWTEPPPEESRDGWFL